MALRLPTNPLQSDALLELFAIDCSIYGGPLITLCNTDTVVYNGYTYNAYPIQSSDFERTTDGKLPEPKIVVSNQSGYVTGLLRLYSDLINCPITRSFVYARHLDTGSDPDPLAYSTPDVFYINYYQENEYTVTFFLRSVFQVGNLMLPRGRLSDLVV